MSAVVSTLFPLGVFVGNPNISDPVAEAAFDARFQDFANLMGAQPLFMDAYIDQRVPVSDWVGNASWAAASYANSPTAKNMIPVIGLPMTSTAAGSPSPDQYYQDFAAGKYDSVIQAMVKSWSDAGFKTQYWRPGWEMNIDSMVSYEGNDTATQADWVKAFQHISNVLHAAGTADGVNMQVMWNPSTINSSASGVATKTVYPGTQYVDVIAADVYGDIYPFGGPSAIYDWSTLQTDNSVQSWASNPVNLQHYYTYPAATQWALDSSQGHSLSLQDLIDFAKAQGKPLAIGETGAGNTADGAGVSDNATFVQWLYSTLANSGVKVDFLAIYDSNGGGNYEFSEAGDNKPLEAAAWAKYFGGHVSPMTVTPAANSVAATDAANVKIFSGVVITDPNAAQTETATVTPSTTVNGMLSDPNAAADGSKITVGAWTVSGTAAAVATAMNGLVFTPAAHQVAPGKTVITTLTASITDTAGQKASTVSTVTITASASPLSVTPAASSVATTDAASAKAFAGVVITDPNAAQTETATVTPSSTLNGVLSDPNAATDGSKIAAGVWTVTGTAAAVATAMNGLLFKPTAQQVAAGKTVVTTLAATVTDSAGQKASTTTTVTTTATAATSPAGTGPDTLVLQMNEDAYQGNAQFTISVDGTQIGGTQTATALRSASQTQAFNATGTFAAGTHQVSINFLNDAYGGTAATDRNLYVNSATINGTAVANASLALMSQGAQSFSFTKSAVAPPDTLVIKVSEDAWQGDAQFTINVDGTPVGGTRTATTSHAAGVWQDVSVTGSWGKGPHAIGISFINDGSGGTAQTDRNLYVGSVVYDGLPATGAPASLLGNSTAIFSTPAVPAQTAITLQLAEDAWQGDAQYNVAIDGAQIGQTGTVTTLNASGGSQAVSLKAMLTVGTHDLAISFLNDAYGGTASTDRNLYVKGIGVNGIALASGSATLLSNGTDHFQIVVPTT